MAGSVSSPFGDPEDMAILDSETEDPEKDPEKVPEPDEIEDEPDLEEEDEEEDKDEEKDDDKDEKDEEEPKDDEKLGNFHDRPTYAQIKKYDPEFFKKFPGIRNLVFQEQAYREIFPTAEEAKDAAEELTNYRAVEKNITSGDPGEFLDVLEEYDTKTATSFTDKFLPTLAKTRPDLFQRVTQPYLKHVLKTISHQAGEDQNLKNAVLHIHNKLFGDFEVEKRAAIPEAKEAPKDEKYEKEKEQFYSQKETDFRQHTASGAKVELTKTLEKLIDPKGALTDYDKRNITRDVLDDIDKTLAADTQHMSLMTSLWNRARKSGWGPEFQERIRTAYLSRVRIIAPGIVQKARSEALKARGKTERPKSASTESSRPNGSGRPQKGRVKDDEIDWRRSSDLDILNDTPKRKK